MNLWEGVPRWINTALLVIVGFIGFNTLFLLLEANETNVIVDFVRDWANFFLAPFEGMFADQDFLLTALIAVLGYSLAAGIALAVVRSVQATARSEHPAAGPAERPVRTRRDREVRAERQRRGQPGVRAERDRTRRVEREPEGPGRGDEERIPPPGDASAFRRTDEGPQGGPEGDPGTGDGAHDRTQRLER